MPHSLPLKILQIGAGSMGSRRLRDLSRRQDVTLGLYDERPDRRKRAEDRFGVRTFKTFREALLWKPAALIISTPPGAKGDYIDLAFRRRLHHFSEADIWTYGAASRAARAPGLVSAPSASLLYLPVIQGLKRLVREHLGSVLSYHLALGTYMPDWHCDEGKEYYARHRDTNPAREMICFELTWLNAVFSPPVEVAGHLQKFGNLPGRIEDTWSLALRLRDGGTGQVSSTMACPKNFLRGCCFGSEALVAWDVQTGEVNLQIQGEEAGRTYQFGASGAVLEAAYATEISTFVDAVLGRAKWPQSYALSQQSTATLAAAEKSFATGRWIKVDPRAEPGRSPPGQARAR